MRPSLTTIIAFALLAGLIQALCGAGVDVLFSDPIELGEHIWRGYLFATGFAWGALWVRRARRNG